MALVELRGVKRVYSQGKVKVHALRGIDLDIEAGEFTALAGPSGSGKTTLLNIIGCLDTADEGTVRIAGRDVSRMNRDELADMRRNHIGFIFQSFNLIPVLTAKENVEFALVLQGRSRQDRARDEERIMAILADVGLKGMEHRRPGELSGGQQQRVAIARALVKAPTLILADEPTANLDSKTGRTVLELMRKMNETRGVTFLFSTHDPMVMEYSRRLITLKDGLIASDERREARDGPSRPAGRP